MPWHKYSRHLAVLGLDGSVLDLKTGLFCLFKPVLACMCACVYVEGCGYTYVPQNMHRGQRQLGTTGSL